MFKNSIKQIMNVNRTISINIYLFILILALIIMLIYARNNISLYINRLLVNMKVIKCNKPYKVVVFDLDETLGYFTEISIFWDALESFYGKKLTNNYFFELLDVFPEFFRPEIFIILNMINNKKKRNICNESYIYTNNQGPKSWTKMINDYFNYKLGFKTFNGIIGAYIVQGKIIEPKRTSHDKSVKDLISCTNIPETSEICFIDDLYHPLMDKDNVNYIHIKPYKYNLTFYEMANRYYDRVLLKNKRTMVNKNLIVREDFVKYIVSFMNRYNYNVIKKTEEKQMNDITESKNLYTNLENFLKVNKPINTRKKNIRKNKTLKQN